MVKYLKKPVKQTLRNTAAWNEKRAKIRFARFQNSLALIFVELQGVEPWSKHIRHKPSTCLFGY